MHVENVIINHPGNTLSNHIWQPNMNDNDCEKCDYQSATKKSLKKHMASKHGLIFLSKLFACRTQHIFVTKVFHNIHLDFTHNPSMMGLDMHVENNISNHTWQPNITDSDCSVRNVTTIP